MTKETAAEKASAFLLDNNNKTVIVTSDGSVYLNNELDVMELHCKENKLEMFVFKGEIKEEVKKETKAKK